MVFDKKHAQIFNQAYGEYQKITQYILDCYLDKDGNEKELLDIDQSYTDALAVTELYMQGNLLKIATADGIVSQFENEFVHSMVNSFDYLNGFDEYRKLMRHLTVDNYNATDKSMFAPADEIPPYISLAVRNDLQFGTSDSVDLMKSTEAIFKCLTEIDDVCSAEEMKETANIIGILRQYITEQGIAGDEAEENISLDYIEDASQDPLQPLLDELNALIGLAEVKEEVLETINLIKVNNLRKEKGLKSAPISHHMVFLGNPGTGKTTVARLISKIYKELGVVTKGHLVETDRSGLVAGYVGQTSIKTKEVATKAIGGILFIDEAYSITRSNSDNDYGKEAIDTLVKIMEDNRDNLVVIVAGYTDEMKTFMSANPGLESRFNKRIFFKDYSQDELLQIFMHTCEKNGFILSQEAVSKAAYLLSECAVEKTFGNARGVRNIFDKAIIKQANRIVNMEGASRRELLTIEKEDIPEVKEMC